MSHALPSGYRVVVDGVDAARWHQVLQGFDDANLYQTWAYESVRSGTRRMSHLLLEHEGRVVAAAQVRIVVLPLTGRGVAYVRWGPLWQASQARPEGAHLEHAVRALHAEYVERRGLSLRILPRLFEPQRASIDGVLRSHAFRPASNDAPQRTLLLPLERPIEQLRSALQQKWRNGLNQAERNGLVLHSGTDDALFAAFLPMHDEMHARKGFHQTSDVSQFRQMQNALDAAHKLRVWIAESNGRPVAGLVCSGIGGMGVYLFGATANAGMQSKASYLLQWQAVLWLKQQGASQYNLHGINPQTNPGTYRFKAGLAGKHAQDLHYVGAFEACARRSDRVMLDLFNRSRQALAGARSALGLGRSKGLVTSR